MGVLVHQQPPGSRPPECTWPGGAGREPGQCHLLPPGLLASSSGSSPPASPTPNSWKTYSPPDNGHLCLHVGTPNHGHTGLETPLPGLPSGFLNKDCGLRFLLPQTHRVHTSPGAPTAVREARLARARPHFPPGGGGGAGPTLVLGLVVVAGLVGDAVPVGVLPHLQVVAPLAGAGLAAVDHVLHGQQRGRPRPLPLDVDPVCKAAPRSAPRRCSPTGPPFPGPGACAAPPACKCQAGRAVPSRPARLRRPRECLLKS